MIKKYTFARQNGRRDNTKTRGDYEYGEID